MLDDQAYDMAMFCIAFKMSPAEYLQLTLRERNAFIEAHQDLHKE